MTEFSVSKVTRVFIHQKNLASNQNQSLRILLVFKLELIPINIAMTPMIKQMLKSQPGILRSPTVFPAAISVVSIILSVQLKLENKKNSQ